MQLLGCPVHAMGFHDAFEVVEIIFSLRWSKMTEGLRSLARNLVDQVVKKCGRGALESSLTKPASENLLQPALPSLERRRDAAMEPEGVHPLNSIAALKTQADRLHSYLEKQFCTLSE